MYYDCKKCNPLLIPHARFKIHRAQQLMRGVAQLVRATAFQTVGRGVRASSLASKTVIKLRFCLGKISVDGGVLESENKGGKNGGYPSRFQKGLKAGEKLIMPL